jgi:hypothetical protein
MRSTPESTERRWNPREATRGAPTRSDDANRSPLHTVYMSAESIAKALAEPVDEPEEVIAIAEAA